MPCQPYRDALIEAAASGEPQGDLISHLAACDDCRAALEQEQSLFASIDAGVHVAANAEVPASLLPRVRARLDEAAASERLRFQPWVLAAASVALALAIFLSARPHYTEPNSQANDGPHSLVSPSVTRADIQNSSASGQVASLAANKSQTLLHPTLLRPVASGQPEVLVPPDEREALSRFVAVLGERGEVALALGRPAPQTKAEPASVEPLQINGLEIKLLEERQTDVSDGAEQKQ